VKLVHVSNGPLPYHTPILNELASLVDLHVVYMSADHPLGSFQDLWGTEPRYSYEMHWSVPLRWRRLDFRAQASLFVSRKLTRLQPDTVLVISWGPLTWEPLVWSRLSRAKAVMWSESTEFSGLLRGRVSNSIRRGVVSLADAVVTESSSATRYVRTLGASKVVTSCLPSPHVPRSTTGPRTEGGGTPAYLFVGRFTPRKRPLEAIWAFEQVASELPGATLTLVGDGPLRREVAEAVGHAGDRVFLLPRLEGERLGRVYGSADVLLVPSLGEGWGLVVNEALAHGLFVVATDEVSSALDLIGPHSGTVVPARDRDAFVRALLEAGTTVRHTTHARRTRARSVEGCTAANFAADIERAALWAWS
jgi:glycosyltransferase involved in cell wall biosynthesis